jgi:hypothetical protein
MITMCTRNTKTTVKVEQTMINGIASIVVEI